MIGGIFPRSSYLWAPTDLLWDGDVNPQGGALHWEQTLNGQWTPYLNTGVWMIDEISSTTNDRVDPFVLHAGRYEVQTGRLVRQYRGDLLRVQRTERTCPDWSAATNTGITTSSNGSCSAGALRYDYDSGGVSAELALATPFDMDFIPEVGVFGDYIANIDGDEIDDSIGWSMGARFGDKKVAGPGQWQFKYIFANLGKDAFVDFTPDSDRYGGRTDVRSHEGILEYGLSKNVTLALDYYQSKRIKATENPEQIIQADVNMKF